MVVPFESSRESEKYIPVYKLLASIVGEHIGWTTINHYINHNKKKKGVPV